MKYKGKCINYECPNDYRPVCGVDGQTYKNDCLLAKAGVNKRAVGRCEMSSTCDHCPLENKPVCGMDGFTYLNVCIMTCLGGRLQGEGACVTDDNCALCPKSVDPVCSSDSITYKNECIFFCRNGAGDRNISVKEACGPSLKFCLS